MRKNFELYRTITESQSKLYKDYFAAYPKTQEAFANSWKVTEIGMTNNLVENTSKSAANALKSPVNPLKFVAKIPINQEKF